VNIRDTIVPLSTDDGCYAFDETHPLSETCYPQECLSPCFDAAGNRLPPGPNVPQMCSCYDDQGALVATPGLCSNGFPQKLTFVLPTDHLPNACKRDDTGKTSYEQICAPYIDPANGQLKPDDGKGSRTPDMCYEICGPLCKALKNAVNGLQYQIHWRADR